MWDSLLGTFCAEQIYPGSRRQSMSYTRANWDERLNELNKKGCQEKTSALTGGREHLGLDVQPTVCTSVPDSLRDVALEGFPFVWFSPRVATLPIGSKRLRKRECCLRGNHGSIRGSWPIAISDYPRGHSVKIGDSLPKQTWPSSLTDTRPRIERLQNSTDHHTEE
jgi:hypothetical protein